MSIGDITISQTVTWIIAAAAALATIAKAIEILRRVFGKRAKGIEEKLKKHDELLDKDNRRISELEEILKDQQTAQTVTCQGTLSIINHMISGNDTEKLREARDKIINFLAAR